MTKWMGRGLAVALLLVLAGWSSAPAAADLEPLMLPQVKNAGGNRVAAVAVVCSEMDGSACSFASSKVDQRTYALASNLSLAAGACATPVTADISAQYGWVYQFSGSSTIMLKFRGPDGSTYLGSQYTATATGSGFVPITAGTTGATVQICNTGSGAVSGLYSTLSS